MIKYRITNEMSHDQKQVEYYIERKRLWGWRKVRKSENGDTRILTFVTYEEAENYLFSKYCRWDGTIYQPNRNEYHYKQTFYNYYG